MKKIYLAGPEVFLPDATIFLEDLKKICSEHGFIGLSPFDSVLKSQNKTSLELAKEIYLGNVSLIQEADIILANCNPFRGAIVDDGTSYEIGHGFALGKKIYGYVNEKMELPKVVEKKIKTFSHQSGFLIDEDGYLVNENFGNTINLMLEFAILESGGELIEGDFHKAISILKEKEIS
ncbi:MAG: nucleoside 2-deoxyribosyltransferase [Leptospiraceae bacterium]|nr:nucleoside 2-deoxyribosyltransferase [Leptospiraceae bacterium]